MNEFLTTILHYLVTIFMPSAILFLITIFFREPYDIYSLVSVDVEQSTLGGDTISKYYMIAKPFNKDYQVRLSISQKDYGFLKGRTKIFVKYWNNGEVIQIAQEDAEQECQKYHKNRWFRFVSDTSLIVAGIALICLLLLVLYISALDESSFLNKILS